MKFRMIFMTIHFPRLATLFFVARILLSVGMFTMLLLAQGERLDSRVSVLEAAERNTAQAVVVTQKDITELRDIVNGSAIATADRLARLETTGDWNTKMQYLILSTLLVQVIETLLSYTRVKAKGRQAEVEG